MQQSDGIEKSFWAVFCRVMRSELEPGNYSVADIESWDSLRHIELIFELEEKFEVAFLPDEVADLYSDTDHVLACLTSKVSG